MPLDDTLRSLLVAQGPSGYEAAPSAAWRTAAERFADSVSVDTMGNLTARVPARAGGEGARTLAIVGHIDEIGLIVTHIDDKGRLFFIGVGGWDPQVLVSQRFELQQLGLGQERGERIVHRVLYRPRRFAQRDLPPRSAELARRRVGVVR